MALEQSYTSRAAGSASGLPDEKSTGKYWPLSKLKKAFQDYAFSKREEIDEQINHRRYYHGSQYTAEQINTLSKRRQPIMTDNRIQRKVDGVVGLVERLRQDPKAYPRTPMHAQGADLATQCIRYVLDAYGWKAKSPFAAKTGSIDGIGGISIELEQGDRGDREVGFEVVDAASFFYDPHSFMDDFSDARYQGEGKWVDEDEAREKWPDAPDDAFTYDTELTSNSDKDMRWFSVEGATRRVRVIHIWYMHGSKWCWATFTGNAILEEGEGYLLDNKKKHFCKYIMYSANVDQDGDRYSLIRNLKSLQDGINAKQSKMQHIIASKRLIISAAAGGDIEKIRQEYSRADGVVLTAGNVNENIKLDDQTFDFAGLGKLLELNLNAIENFGPNPALIGQGVETKSGRAISLLQQAGMAELGPFILAYRGWKERAYRAIWSAIQQHWTAERYIRVTDDEDLMYHLEINKLERGPDGRMVIINAVGQLDVDIVLDEGPDSMTMAQDTYDTLVSLAQSGAQVPPDIIIELSPNIDSRTKKTLKQRFQQAQQQPPPELQVEQMKQQGKEREMMLDAQLEQQKNQGKLELETRLGELEIENERMKIELEHQAKLREQELDAACKEREMNQQAEHEGRKMNMEAEHKVREANIGLQVKREEAQIGAETERDKAQVQQQTEVHKANLDRESKKEEHEMKAKETADVKSVVKDALQGIEDKINALQKQIAARR